MLFTKYNYYLKDQFLLAKSPEEKKLLTHVRGLDTDVGQVEPFLDFAKMHNFLAK